MKESFGQVLASIMIQLMFLAAGIILVGLGSNFYLAFGIACLIIYSNSVK